MENGDPLVNIERKLLQGVQFRLIRESELSQWLDEGWTPVAAPERGKPLVEVFADDPLETEEEYDGSDS